MMQVDSQFLTDPTAVRAAGDFRVFTEGSAGSLLRLEESLLRARTVPQKVHAQSALGWALLQFDARRALQLGKSARDAAYEGGDAGGLAFSLVVIALAQTELHNLKEAELLLEEARTRYQQLGDSLGATRVLLGMGIHAHSAGKNEQAVHAVEKALALFNRLGEPNNRVYAMVILAEIYAQQGNRFPEALQLNLQALELTEQHGLLERQTLVLANLGQQYVEIGDYDRARKYLYRGLEIVQGNTSPLINLQKQQACLLTSLSSMCLALGHYQKALAYALQSLEIEPSEHTGTLRARTQNNLGKLYFHLQSLDTAYTHYQQAAALARGIHSLSEEAHALLGMGRVRLAENDLSEARLHFESAGAITASGAYPSIQYRVHQAFAELYKQMGEAAQALDHQERSHQIKDAVFNTQSDLRLKTLEVVHGLESARREAEFHRAQNIVLQNEVEERKRAEAAARSRAEEMEALREIMTDIAAELDLSTLLQKIVRRVAELLEAEAGELALVDEARQELETRVSFNQNRDYTGQRRSLSSGGMGYAAKFRRTIFIEDDALWEHRDEAFKSAKPLSLLYTPLLVWNRLVGVIAVAADKQRHFDQADIHLLEMFAQQAAIAIHNAQLFQQMKDLAATDPLTGARNRRSLLERVEEEFNRARRGRHPLSVILVDIDHFKSINDTYGHTIGDDILRQVSQVCRQSLREVDFLGRQGGKSFILLQPEAPINDALLTAQRLQSEIDKMKIAAQSGEINFTISIGVVELSEADRSPDMLLERVDQAMYRAKKGGRNCVSL